MSAVLNQVVAATPQAPPPPPVLSVQDRILLELARRGGDSAMHLGLSLLLDGEPPTMEQLVDHLRARLTTTPELTFRIGGSPRRPRWEPDPSFDLRRHVHEHHLEPGSLGGPDEVLTELLDRPLPRDRPLWGIWLVRRPSGFALCYRAHHAFQDGLAAAETVERLFGPPPVSLPVPLPVPLPSGPLSSPGSELPAVVPDEPLRWNAALLKELLPPMRRTTRWSALDVAPDSQLGDRRVAYTAGVELTRLYGIGRATGANVNQICLAVLTAALRTWHPADWAAPGPGLRATLAVSVRPAGGLYRRLGNCSGVASVPLPCSEPSPLEQLRLLREQVTFARFAELGRRHRVLYQKMPYWCGSLSLSRSIDPRYTPLTLADVRLRKPLAFAGEPVAAVLPLPVSVPGQPLFVAWTTHRGRLSLTFLTDTAVPGGPDLPRLWCAALDVLESAAEHSAAPGLRPGAAALRGSPDLPPASVAPVGREAGGRSAGGSGVRVGVLRRTVLEGEDVGIADDAVLDLDGAPEGLVGLPGAGAAEYRPEEGEQGLAVLPGR
ncbi:diacylglycerol O-acyltransferase [Kitasatospora sp. MAP5-34]|nr:diacylglycerol O-acyltransferase [Kitasatospora sp. MAP5-34]